MRVRVRAYALAVDGGGGVLIIAITELEAQARAKAQCGACFSAREVARLRDRGSKAFSVVVVVAAAVDAEFSLCVTVTSAITFVTLASFRLIAAQSACGTNVSGRRLRRQSRQSRLACKAARACRRRRRRRRRRRAATHKQARARAHTHPPRLQQPKSNMLKRVANANAPASDDC